MVPWVSNALFSGFFFFFTFLNTPANQTVDEILGAGRSTPAHEHDSEERNAVSRDMIVCSFVCVFLNDCLEGTGSVSIPSIFLNLKYIGVNFR